jgi:hypothetical protein
MLPERVLVLDIDPRSCGLDSGDHANHQAAHNLRSNEDNKGQ